MKFLETCDGVIVNVDEISTIGRFDENSTVRMTNHRIYNFLKVPETFTLPDGTEMPIGIDEIKVLHRCTAWIITDWFKTINFMDYELFESNVWEKFAARYQVMIEEKESEDE